MRGLVVAVALLVASIVVVAATPLRPWSVGPSLRTARQEVAAVLLGDRLIVVGGFARDATSLASVEALHVGGDTSSEAWEDLPPMPVGVHHPAAAVVGGRLIVVGGYVAAGALSGPTDAVQIFDAATDSWSLGTPLPTPRGGLAAVAWDERVWVVGGAGDHATGDGGAVAELLVYDPDVDAWERRAPMPTARDHLAFVVTGDRLHALGGRDGRAFTLDAHEVYDPRSDAWSVAPPVPTGRSGHAAVAGDGCIVVLGGEGHRARRDGLFTAVEAFELSTGTWRSLRPMPRPRHGMGAVHVDDTVWVVGGGDVAGFGAVDVVDRLYVGACR